MIFNREVISELMTPSKAAIRIQDMLDVMGHDIVSSDYCKLW